MKKRKKASRAGAEPAPVAGYLGQFRLLAMILAVSLALGFYESSRSDLPKSLAQVDPAWLLDEQVNISKTLLELYPNRSHGYFLRAYQAGMCWERGFGPAVCGSFPHQDLRDARVALEDALRRGGDYEHEALFHFYAFILTQLNEPPESVDDAVKLWRKHYPYSQMPDPRGDSPPPAR